MLHIYYAIHYILLVIVVVVVVVVFKLKAPRSPLQFIDIHIFLFNCLVNS